MLLRFEPAAIELEVHAGERIVDITDAHPESGVPYSCRAANCGTCRVQVVEGEEAFAPLQADESAVLEIFGNEEGVRLGCQLRIQQQVPRICLKVIDP